MRFGIRRHVLVLGQQRRTESDRASRKAPESRWCWSVILEDEENQCYKDGQMHGEEWWQKKHGEGEEAQTRET